VRFGFEQERHHRGQLPECVIVSWVLKISPLLTMDGFYDSDVAFHFYKLSATVDERVHDYLFEFMNFGISKG